MLSFLNTRSDFLTVAVVPALLATPSAALGDSVSSASVAARPIYGNDVLEDHGCLTPSPHMRVMILHARKSELSTKLNTLALFRSITPVTPRSHLERIREYTDESN